MTPEIIAHLLALMTGEGPAALDLERLATASPAAMTAGGGERRAGTVAVIPVTGLLVPRSLSTWFGTIGGQDGLRRTISAAARNPDVSAIVLDVDSPGGIVAGTAETAETVRAAAASKPVVAVANPLAASAAYWIAAQASEVVAVPGADVGSIGIVVAHQNVSRLQERMGVETTLIRAGKYKAEANPFEPLGEEARAAIQERVDAAYAAFVDDVARGRKTTAKAVREGFGEGRVVEARRALSLGMVDRVATLDAVVAALAANRRRPRTPRRSAIAFA